MIRPVIPGDAKAICGIYNHYVQYTIVTFEEENVSEQDMEERILQTTKKFPWLVFEIDGSIEGYAYAGEWKSRCAYRFSVESTIYLKNGLEGKGIGTQLYSELLKALPLLNIHSVIGGIALPNDGCIALHEKFGFEKIGQFREVGFKFNKWIDVGYWEKIY
jgi:phosphinothricin acetyltransferase